VQGLNYDIYFCVSRFSLLLVAYLEAKYLVINDNLWFTNTIVETFALINYSATAIYLSDKEFVY
jgi:hypothetical protein